MKKKASLQKILTTTSLVSIITTAFHAHATVNVGAGLDNNGGALGGAGANILDFNSTNAATFTNKVADEFSKITSTGGNALGTVHVNGDNLVVNGNVGSDSNRLKTIEIDAGKTFGFFGNLYTSDKVSLGGVNSTLELTNNNASIREVYSDISTSVKNEGIIQLTRTGGGHGHNGSNFIETRLNGQIGDNVNPLEKIILQPSADNFVWNVFRKDVYAGEISVNQETERVQFQALSNGQTIEVHSAITTPGDGLGRVFARSDEDKTGDIVEFHGKLGTPTNRLNNLSIHRGATAKIYNDIYMKGTGTTDHIILEDLETDNKIIFCADNLTIDSKIRGSNGTGVVEINANNINIKGFIGNTGVTFHGFGGGNVNGILDKIVINANASLIADDDFHVANGITFGNANSQLTLTKDNATFDTVILAETNGAGKLLLDENLTVTKNIGTNDKSINLIQVAEDKAITAKADIYAQELLLKGNGNAKLILNQADITVAAPIAIENHQKNTIEVNKNATIKGNIATDKNTRLGALVFTDDDVKLRLEGNKFFIEEIDFDSKNNAELTFFSPSADMDIDDDMLATLSNYLNTNAKIEVGSGAGYTATMAKQIGTDNNANRFDGTIILSGAGDNVVTADLFARKITVNGGGTTEFNNALDMGDNAEFKVENAQTQVQLDNNLTQGDNSSFLVDDADKINLTGTITQGDDATFTVNNSDEITFAQDFQQGDNATLTLTSSDKLTFNGDFKQTGTGILEINDSDEITFTGAFEQVGANSKVTITNSKKITFNQAFEQDDNAEFNINGGISEITFKNNFKQGDNSEFNINEAKKVNVHGKVEQGTTSKFIIGGNDGVEVILHDDLTQTGQDNQFKINSADLVTFGGEVDQQGVNGVFEINDSDIVTFNDKFTQGDDATLTINNSDKITFKQALTQGTNSKFTIDNSMNVTFEDDFTQGAGSTLSFDSTGSIIFAGQTKLKTIDFKDGNGLISFTGAGSEIATEIKNDGPSGNGRLSFSTDFALDIEVGSANKKLKYIEINNSEFKLSKSAYLEQGFIMKGDNAHLKLVTNNNLVIDGPILTNISGQGKIDFDVDTTVKSNIGTGTRLFEEIGIAVGKILKTDGSINSHKLTLKGAGSGVQYNNAIFSNPQTHTNIANQGELTFSRATVLNNTIGSKNQSLSKVIFENNVNKIKSEKDIYAKNITFGANQLIPSDNVKYGAVGGEVDFSETRISLGSNNIKLIGDIKFNNSKLEISRNFNGYGKLNNINATKLDLNGIEINFNDQAGFAANNTELLIIGSNVDVTNIESAKLTINGALDLVQWKLDKNDDNNIILKAKRKATLDSTLKKQRESGDNVNDSAIELAELIERTVSDKSFNSNSAFAKFIQQVASTPPEKRAEILNRFNPGRAESVKAIDALSNSSVEMLGNRLNEVGSDIGVGTLSSLKREQKGVAAGDLDSLQKSGWWLKGFGMAIRQSLDGDINSYKANLGGGALGFDSVLCDKFLIGVGYSYSNMNLNYRGNKLGDSVKLGSSIFNVYGQYKINDQWFARGMMYMGHNRIRSRELKFEDNKYKISRSNYDSYNYGVTGSLGYNYQYRDDILLTPIIAMRYSRVLDDGYKQEGTLTQNPIIERNSHNKLVAVGGLQMKKKQYFDNGILNFGLHSFANVNVMNSPEITTSRLDGMPKSFTSRGPKERRLGLDLGANIEVEYSKVKLSLDYNMHLKKRFHSHTGSIKLHVQF